MIVNIEVKDDYFAYLTCSNDVLTDAIKKSFVRVVNKYNNYWKKWETVSYHHYTLVKNGDIIKIKAGLVDFLIESLKYKNIKYNLIDNRIKVEYPSNIITQLNKEVKLRDYQKDAVEAVFKNPYSCIQLMTGSGKTEVSASIIKTYLQSFHHKTKGILYVVPTIKLQKEAKERFTKYDIKCNTKLPLQSESTVNIITYMALVRSNLSKEECDRISVIIYDECHKLKGNKSSKITHKFNKLQMCIGCSATVTPDIQYKKRLKQLNNDDFDIIGCTGKPVYYRSIAETIKTKTVTPIKVTVVDNPEIIKLPEDLTVDWHTVKSNILRSDSRAELVVEALNKVISEHSFNTIMLLIPEIEWSRQFMDIVYKNGPKDYNYILMFGQDRFEMYIDGNLKIIKYDKDKEYVYEQLIKNPEKKTIFSATSFAYEGLDIPNLQALFNIYGGRSDTRVKQQIGRLTRLFKSKDLGYIYEFYDKNPVCKSQLKKRLSIYKNEYDAQIDVLKLKEEEV